MANDHTTISGNSYEKIKSFRYLGYLLTNQNSIHEEIKCILKAENSCYYSVQTLLFLYKTIILPIVLCGCETWSFMLREDCRRTYFFKQSSVANR